MYYIEAQRTIGMKFLLMISHPAQFHMYRNIIGKLKEHSHQVVIVIRPKDILEQLCEEANVSFYKVNERSNKCGRLGYFIAFFSKIFAVMKIVRRERPNLLAGCDGTIAYVGRLLGLPSIGFTEDDYSIIKLYADIFFPVYNKVIIPYVCDAGKWSHKKIGYAGYQKLTYLHPNYFTPDKKVVEKYFPVDESPYYIIRFAKLSAHHDVGVNGFSREVAQRVIDMLKAKGRVFITSETELPHEFEPYRLRINPLDIHHLLAFASLYIGDSQSMAVEACMLGTPCLRFNDFVGKKKISVLEELEHVYHLTNGIHSSDADTLYKRIDEILTLSDARPIYLENRQRMLKDKIDVTKYWTWFIENYPQSAVQHEEKSPFWGQFK